MKILHTGDLHLDSAFCALGARNAEYQRAAGRELLTKIFNTAKEENCQMLLISGDLFDSKFVSPESSALFCKLVENSNIPVVLSPGNHDFYFENSFYAKAQKRLGERLTLFSSPELQIFDFDELRVRVMGYAFCSAALTESPLSGVNIPKKEGYVSLLCAHADIASPVSRYAPITLSEIEALGVDYAALGHIHNGYDRLGNDRVKYCGFPEGRSFDELGEGGVWIVDIAGKHIECTRKILSQQSFYIYECDIPEHDSEAELGEALCRLIGEKNYPKGTHLRLVLCGSCADSSVINNSLEAMVLEKCELDALEIIDRTLPLLDGEYLERDSTLRGELYRTLKPMLISADPEERRRGTMALKIGLSAIDGRSIYGANGGRV